MLSGTPLRRTLTATTLVVAVPLVLLAGSGPTAVGASDANTFTMRATAASFDFVDLPPTSDDPQALPGPGDYFVLKNKLFRGGNRVGALHATCVVTSRGSSPDRRPLLCNGVYRLRGGTLAGTALLSTASRVNRIVISGGTGRFAGMSGTATESPIDDDTSRVVVRIR